MGTTLFPPARPTGKPTRFEAGALAAALIAATFIGAAMPGSPNAQAQGAAQQVVVAAAVPIEQGAVAGTTASSADEPAATASGTADAPAETTDEPLATPAAATDDSTTADDSAADDSGDDAAGDEDDGSDPLAGSGEHLDQVALVIVHGDAPVRWPTAATGSPARKRAENGTTLTGVAATPSAPLATSLALIAGQASNPRTREGCNDGAPNPLTPGTIDDLGRVAGTGCDFPSGTPSLPSAIAIDGRRWKAYSPVGETEAASALCGTGSPSAAAANFAGVSALRRLSDLSSSGACESAAAPLSALASDLVADEPPAWILVEVGACATTGCDADAAAARDRDLDAALTTLTGVEGLSKSSAVLVVGDGTATDLEASPAGSMPAAPDDPGAPAAVLSGALLLGPGVSAGTTDPLALDPFTLARTQADWLGVDAPGWAKADGVSGLAVPSG